MPFLVKEVSFHELKEVNGKQYYSSVPFSGIATTYFDNGQMSIQYSFKEGLKSGLERHWYDNGRAKAKYIYKANFFREQAI